MSVGIESEESESTDGKDGETLSPPI